MSVLQHQNQKLAIQLEEKRKENKYLQEKVNQYEAREQEYAQTLLCVNRVWDQLQRDVEHLCTTSGLPNGANGQEGEASGSGRQQETPPIPANITDPFLRRLLSGADAPTIKLVQDGCKYMAADYSEVEEALVARADACKAALANLLRHLQQQPTPDVDQAKLKEQLQHQAAQQRILADKLKLADDRYLETQQQLKKLQNELADCEQELSNATRKYIALKGQGEAAGGGEQGQGSGGGSAKGTPAPGIANEEAQEELTELRELLNKRTAELEKEQEGHLKTQRCVPHAHARRCALRARLPVCTPWGLAHCVLHRWLCLHGHAVPLQAHCKCESCS